MQDIVKVNVDDYGSIQHAIDANNHAERLELLIPACVHVTGPLTLRSNLTITFEQGAIVQFEDNPDLYPPVWTRWEGVECYAMHPLLYADGAHDIVLRGAGVIDGAGAAWWDKFRQIRREDRMTPQESYELRLAQLNSDYRTRTGGGGRPSTQFLRPPLAQFWKCQNITLRRITLQNSPFWTLHLVYSSHITIDSVTFRNPSDSINTDAMDIDSSHDVEIRGCLIDVGDDGITLKSGSGPDGMRIGIPTENVQVSNCRILASHGGIAIGSETAAGIRNVRVQNCQFQGTERGVRLKSRRTRGGTIENIVLRDLHMDRCWCPIAFNLYYASGVLLDEEATVFSADPQPVDSGTPHIRNVEIQNVQATNVRASAAFIVGLPESRIDNVNISNFTWTLAPADELLPTTQSEMAGGRFHDQDRGIKTINVSRLTVNGKFIA